VAASAAATSPGNAILIDQTENPTQKKGLLAAVPNDDSLLEAQSLTVDKRLACCHHIAFERGAALVTGCATMLARGLLRITQCSSMCVRVNWSLDRVGDILKPLSSSANYGDTAKHMVVAGSH
jgi:hypothetical protein